MSLTLKGLCVCLSTLLYVNHAAETQYYYSSEEVPDIITCSDDESCDIYCYNYGTCQNMVIDCGSTADCNVHCGYYSCRNSIITSDSSVKESVLNVDCDSTHACRNVTANCNSVSECNLNCNYQYSCYAASFNADQSDDASVYCGATYACYNAELNGGTADNLAVSCPSNYGCYYVNIYGESATELTVSCSAYYGCYNMDLLAEKAKDVSVDCSGNTYACYYADISGYAEKDGSKSTKLTVSCSYSYGCYYAEIDCLYSRDCDVSCTNSYACQSLSVDGPLTGGSSSLDVSCYGHYGCYSLNMECESAHDCNLDCIGYDYVCYYLNFNGGTSDTVNIDCSGHDYACGYSTFNVDQAKNLEMSCYSSSTSFDNVCYQTSINGGSGNLALTCYGNQPCQNTYYYCDKSELCSLTCDGPRDGYADYACDDIYMEGESATEMLITCEDYQACYDMNIDINEGVIFRVEQGEYSKSDFTNNDLNGNSAKSVSIDFGISADGTDFDVSEVTDSAEFIFNLNEDSNNAASNWNLNCPDLTSATCRIEVNADSVPNNEAFSNCNLNGQNSNDFTIEGTWVSNDSSSYLFYNCDIYTPINGSLTINIDDSEALRTFHNIDILAMDGTESISLSAAHWDGLYVEAGASDYLEITFEDSSVALTNVEIYCPDQPGNTTLFDQTECKVDVSRVSLNDSHDIEIYTDYGTAELELTCMVGYEVCRDVHLFCTEISQWDTECYFSRDGDDFSCAACYHSIAPTDVTTEPTKSPHPAPTASPTSKPTKSPTATPTAAPTSESEDDSDIDGAPTEGDSAPRNARFFLSMVIGAVLLIATQ